MTQMNTDAVALLATVARGLKLARATESITWIDPKKEKPDAETTVLLACADGEVIPGYLSSRHADARRGRVGGVAGWASVLFPMTPEDIKFHRDNAPRAEKSL